MQVLSKPQSDTRVTIFLNSIGRNSNNSRKTYYTGLTRLAEFLSAKPSIHKGTTLTPNTIIPALQSRKVDVYELLDNFVSYLSTKTIAVPSLKLYVSAVKSYAEFNDIDIVPSKFRRRVKMPKYYPDAEEPLGLSDIRELLEFCSNTRLRTFILLLTSTGLRVTEAASLRLMEIDFTTSPTKVNVRREYSKTKRSRTVYCSDETTKHLKKLIEGHVTKKQEDLIFAMRSETRTPRAIYHKLLARFERLQHTAGKDQRKENSKRRKITLHSFRRTCFSVINEQTNSEYANWFLGHNHSVYWTHKEPERREIYKNKCMPFLTIYQDTRDNSIETALKEKDRTIKLLTNRIADIEHDQKIIMDLLQEPDQLKKKLES